MSKYLKINNLTTHLNLGDTKGTFETAKVSQQLKLSAIIRVPNDRGRKSHSISLDEL